jgi:hypothetical protein
MNYYLAIRIIDFNHEEHKGHEENIILFFRRVVSCCEK